jgi:hypothetical protein
LNNDNLSSPISNLQSPLKKHGGLPLIIALYGLLAFAYSLLMPMWEAPDESAHFMVIHYYVREGRPPNYDETYEAIQPPLYYWLAGHVVRLLDQSDPDLTPVYRPPLAPREAVIRYAWADDNYRFMWGQHVLRWLNILVGGLTLTFIYKATGRFTEAFSPANNDNLHQSALTIRVPFATTVFIALTPQYLHNSAAIGNDPIANLGGAVLFYILALLCTRPLLSGHTFALIIAAAFAFPLLLKATILPISLVVLLVAGWQARRAWLPRWPWLLGGGLLLAAVLVAAMAYFTPDTAALIQRTIWWRLTYIRDDFPRHWPLARIAAFYIAGYWGQVAWEDVRLPLAIRLFLTSFAVLGWLHSLRLLLAHFSRPRFWLLLSIPAAIVLAAGWFAGSRSDWWHIPPLVFITYLAIWFLTFLWHGRRDPAGQLTVNRWLWAAVWLAAVFAILIVFKNFLTTPQYQGRFFFPTLGPLTLLITAGWFAALPPRLSAYLPHLIATFLILTNLIFWFTHLIPTYYQPFLD